MTVKFISKGPKLHADKIKELETSFSMKLPHDYRDFISVYNVAIPEANKFENVTITTSVSKFFGISEHEGDDLSAQIQTYEGRMPRKIIPIGLAGGGNVICLRLEDGTIFFWDHEQEAPEGEVPGYGNMLPLAPSFSDFLMRLQPFKTDDVTLNPEDVISVKIKPDFHEKFKKYK
jgi:hypothetical protein